MWQKAKIVTVFMEEEKWSVGLRFWVKVSKPTKPQEGATCFGFSGERFNLTEPFYETNLRCPHMVNVCVAAAHVELIPEFANQVEMQDI